MENPDQFYFDLRVGGVAMLDADRMVPADPGAAWLLRETADGWTQAKRLALARRDLERLQSGWLPPNEVLASAPLLEEWSVITVNGSLSLLGIVVGHPKIADGRHTVTSVVVALDVATLIWARTVSRFFRLGRQREVSSTA